MGRCAGACAGFISREHYLPIVEYAVRFLRGNYRDLLKSWRAEMKGLANEMKFEEAARLRDRIAIVEQTLVSQRVGRPVPGDVDAVGWFRDGDEGTAALLHVREGRLSDAHTYHFRVALSEGESITSFLLQHYAEGAYFPGGILLPFGIPDRLASLCRLPKPPVRIEGFDISNIGGAEPSGSMVTFVGGKGVKKWYRKFAVRGTAGQGDFAMMGEGGGGGFGSE